MADDGCQTIVPRSLVERSVTCHLKNTFQFHFIIPSQCPELLLLALIASQSNSCFSTAVLVTYLIPRELPTARTSTSVNRSKLRITFQRERGTTKKQN